MNTFSKVMVHIKKKSINIQISTEMSIPEAYDIYFSPYFLGPTPKQ